MTIENTHPFWCLPVTDAPDGAALLLTPCPGTKNISLADSLTQLIEAGGSLMITALEQSDLPVGEFDALAALCREKNLDWIHLPIVDDEIPTDHFEAQWPKTNEIIQATLNSGRSVIVHCKGGSGRTGIIAARILLRRGQALPDIIARIQALRPNAFTLSQHIRYIYQCQDAGDYRIIG